MWEHSSVSCTVILLEVPPNRHWCKDCTPLCLLAVFRDTGSYSAVKLVAELPKKPMVKVKVADPELTTCDSSRYFTLMQDSRTAEGLAVGERHWMLFCLQQCFAVHATTIQLATHRSNSFQSFMPMSQPLISAFPASQSKFPSPGSPRLLNTLSCLLYFLSLLSVFWAIHIQ